MFIVSPTAAEQRAEVGQAGAAARQVTAADGRAQVSEARAAPARLLHTGRRHRGQGPRRLRAQQVSRLTRPLSVSIRY